MYTAVRNRMFEAMQVVNAKLVEDREAMITTEMIVSELGDIVTPVAYERYGQPLTKYFINFAMPESMLDKLTVNNFVDYLALEDKKALLLHFLANRTKVIAGIASTMQLSTLTENLTVSTGGYQIPVLEINTRYLSVDYLENRMANLNRNPKLTKGDLTMARRQYNMTVQYLTGQVNDNSPVKKSSIGQVLTDRKAVELDYDTAYAQLRAATAGLENGLTARTWGWELEVADAKRVRVNARGIDTSSDSSIKSYDSYDDCDCSCNECRYHVCDCEDCENNNDDPQHCNDSYCSNADSVEFKSTAGIQRTRSGTLGELIQKLEDEDAEVNDSCGIHIHVFAADLDAKQVGGVMAAYKLIKPMFNELMLRDDVEYSYHNTSQEISGALSNKLHFNKMRDVNVSHLVGSRGTIEFRQAEARLDYEFIIGWAFVLRGLVTSFKRGANISNFFNLKSIQELFDVFAKFSHTVATEHPEEFVYGSMNDESFIKRNTFERA